MNRNYFVKRKWQSQLYDEWDGLKKEELNGRWEHRHISDIRDSWVQRNKEWMVEAVINDLLTR